MTRTHRAPRRELAIAPGERVPLRRDRSGKSTINHLDRGLAAPPSGEVWSAVLSLRSPRRSARSGRAVFQTSFLFAMSLRDNIVLDAESSMAGPTSGPRCGAPRSRDRFIPQLAEGWDTVVGERGVTLSGGQRQRVALARARCAASDPVARRRDSAVDPTVEASILDSLRTDDRRC
jgi:ABC-type multidrug transport system fused ATPase/permease subunit